MIIKTKRILTKKGDAMLFATVQDSTGEIEILVFPKLYLETSFVWNEDALVSVDGNVSTKDKMVKILADTVKEVDSSILASLPLWEKASPPVQNKAFAGNIVISLPSKLKKETLEKLKKIFQNHPGSTRVQLAVMDAQNHPQKHIQTHTYINLYPATVSAISDIVGSENVRTSALKEKIS